MRTPNIKVLDILSNGNNAKIVLVKMVGGFYVIKKYYQPVTAEFLREKEVLKRLNHPNILMPLRLGKTRSFTFEFLRSSLRSLMISERSIERDVLETCAIQVTDALRYMHSNGIVHFDLKPENILISNGTFKIIDFGSAKYIGEVIKVADFTPMYTSLEYLIGLKTAHGFKDIWSLGCILYEMICYRPLFKGRTGIQIVLEILKIFGSPSDSAFSTLDVTHLYFFNIFDYQPLTENLPDVDQKCLQKLHRIFEMDPLNRITADELCDGLKSILN